MNLQIQTTSVRASATSAANGGQLRRDRPAPTPKLPRRVSVACRIALAVAVVGLAVSGCHTGKITTPSTTMQAVTNVFFPEKLAEMDAAIEKAIISNNCPGGVLWLERDGAAYVKAYGSRALVPEKEPMTEDTVFDMASVTKVMAATPAIMLLIERGKVNLDAPVKEYLPGFTGDGKEAVTLRNLLTHTSGLPPGIGAGGWKGKDGAVRTACGQRLRSKPGTEVVYSDINFFLVGAIVERVTGQELDKFLAAEVYEPLKMNDTCFRPPESERGRIAPTEVRAGVPFRGTVHDPTARQMGGVAGHAGLFSTASDVARYARMLLNLGELDGVRIFKPETVQLMTSVQTPPAVTGKRGLGWDIDTGYSGPRGKLFPVGSYGHTGWTGTSLWIDPFSKTFVIFLSNRNHPTETGAVLSLRRQLGTLAAEAVRGYDFTAK